MSSSHCSYPQLPAVGGAYFSAHILHVIALFLVLQGVDQRQLVGELVFSAHELTVLCVLSRSSALGGVADIARAGNHDFSAVSSRDSKKIHTLCRGSGKKIRVASWVKQGVYSVKV